MFLFNYLINIMWLKFILFLLKFYGSGTFLNILNFVEIQKHYHIMYINAY